MPLCRSPGTIANLPCGCSIRRRSKDSHLCKRLAHGTQGAGVQEALVQVWDKANRICAKRLIPFPYCLKKNLCPQTLQKPYPASLRVSVGSGYPFALSLLAQRPEMGYTPSGDALWSRSRFEKGQGRSHPMLASCLRPDSGCDHHRFLPTGAVPGACQHEASSQRSHGQDGSKKG